MSEQQASPCPTVMCFSGHDPGGGAGIQADIEAIAANGGHAVTITTALTIQDTCNVAKVIAVNPDDLVNAATQILEDMPVACFKIGLLGDATIATAVATVIAQHPAIPVVFDPVLASGAGTPLADAELLTVIREKLLPITTLITPNTLEAEKLTGQADIQASAHRLLDSGCQHVLITGTHADTTNVVNTLYGAIDKEFVVPRLDGEFHGSGCTLASCIAAQLAHGQAMPVAVKTGIDYTWQTLKHARPLGKGQAIPNRFFYFEDKKF